MTTRAVLYIEDNAANRFLMERIVARFPSTEMVSAETAEHGLELANTSCPDLILMDINLPGMDGFQALDELRANERTRDIPVIALSANVMPPDIERGQSAGFHDYLTKPFNIGHVVNVIAAALDRTP